MSGIFNFLRSLVKPSSTPTTQFVKKTIGSEVSRDISKYAEGDRLLINGRKISAPLRKNVIDLDIPHNDVIGQCATRPLYLKTKAGLQKLEYPSFEQYVTLAPRVVTPIYPSYASFIVSLLDLHVQPLSTNNTSSKIADETLEILDAGTGHGSVTIHLARAIAGANPSPPALEFPDVPPRPTRFAVKPSLTPEQTDLAQAWSVWRTSRRAVVHTVEATATTSRHADKLIRAYRQGMYWPHIDFHVAKVEDWVEEQMRTRNEYSSHDNPANSVSRSDQDGFLSHAVLDLPAVHERLSIVSSALRTDGTLIVFAPSVTQIGDCVRMIHKLELPLLMDNVIELGEGLTNGRKWDVRLVTPRSQRKITKEIGSKPQSGDDTEDIEHMTESGSDSVDGKLDPAHHEPVMVCRPKVGEVIQGGGFIGIWKKASQQSDGLEFEWLQSSSSASGKKNRKRR